MTLMDPFLQEFQNVCQKFSERKALADNNGSLTYAQLKERIDTFASRLENLSPCSVVGMVLPNGIDFVVAFMAIISSGFVAAPLNPIYTVEELEFYLKDCDASIVISDLENAISAASSLDIPVLSMTKSGNVPANDKPYDSKLKGVGLVLHTSGTTSKPKLVPIRTDAMLNSLKHLIDAYKLSEIDRVLIVMPLFHVHGLMGCLLTTLFSGGTATIPEKFSSHKFMAELRDSGATWISAVPTIYHILLSEPNLFDPEYIKGQIRFIRACSSALPTELWERMSQLVNGVPIFQAYAMTEAAHLVSTGCFVATGPSGSVGRPLGCQVAIYNGDQLCEANVPGEICVSGFGIMRGYIRPEATNATAFVGKYFRTGDLGHLDADGFLTVSGRIKDLINRGGEKINPNEVDAVIQKSDLVKEAACFALPDKTYGEIVACVVVLQKAGEAMDANHVDEILTEHCKVHLASFKCPLKFFYAAEIPKSSIGKMQRSNLTKLYQK